MSYNFQRRHIGVNTSTENEMLTQIGVGSIKELIENTIPQNIRLKKELDIADAMTESEYLNHINQLGQKNKLYRTYIGQGYYNTITPSVILRNILENPGWYTAYTPYQAEISQGRLEALLNFQTMVCDLTGMEIANASLLDEATAAAEAMIMVFNDRTREQKKDNAVKFFVSELCYPQTISVLKTRSKPLGIELVIGNHHEMNMNDGFFGAIIQYPTVCGEVYSYSDFTSRAHSKDIKIIVAADIMSLALLTPPGEWGADVVVGNTQRFGVPMGYGGPHAAYFATKEEFKRNLPGRIIGVSKDRQGKMALRMALQTREQHIRRDKATSNICTAQALLAVMAGMYAVYHGEKGIRAIAFDIHAKATFLRAELSKLGFKIANKNYFDTITINVEEASLLKSIQLKAEEKEINFHYFFGQYPSISIDETVTKKDLVDIISIFGGDIKESDINLDLETFLDRNLFRTSPFLTHDVFNSYHSETEMMRYIKKLENRDLSLVHSMISLGSCTMKLNAASELIPITNPYFSNIHPFVPIEQAKGYQEMLAQLAIDLSEITGFYTVSLQPNSGAQGEYAGLMVIRAYHESNGDTHRNIALIPSSAHGTNPATAVMAGMEIVVVKCDEKGNIDITDLKEKAEKHSANLACLMVTYPSTHGVFEEGIIEITNIIHQHGGQVYMDGANMNAQVGLTSPGNIGADVCHLNLHKTFAIPHGGGGPGMGPIGVAKHLAPFLPTNPFVKTGGDKAIEAISAAPWGSALILLISYGYIKMLGAEGLRKSTEIAILNANYMKNRLEKEFDILYKGNKGNVAHEMILDCREFKKTAKIEVVDIAKRLIDYGFHAPTVSFPVAGTLMIEPTESESKAELDRFCDAMLSIREEIRAIEQGKSNDESNPLKNAPHTMSDVLDWKFDYSLKQGVMPISYLNEYKYWAPVNRIDDAYGDRNLICSCPDISEYQNEVEFV